MNSKCKENLTRNERGKDGFSNFRKFFHITIYGLNIKGKLSV